MHDIWFAQRVPDGGGHVGRLNAVQEVEAAARSIFPPAAQVFLRLAAEGLVLQMAASSSVPNSLYVPPPRPNKMSGRSPARQHNDEHPVTSSSSSSSTFHPPPAAEV